MVEVTFSAKNPQDYTELQHIAIIVIRSHFRPDEYFWSTGGLFLKVSIFSHAYKADIEKSNKRLEEVGYQTDFVSDVQENLSFVPTVNVEL